MAILCSIRSRAPKSHSWQAANRGAKEAGGLSIGCNIRLPREQEPNAYLDKFIQLEHFLTGINCASSHGKQCWYPVLSARMILRSCTRRKASSKRCNIFRRPALTGPIFRSSYMDRLSVSA